MNFSNEIPHELREISANREKRREFYAIIGRGEGTIEIGGKEFVIEPSFKLSKPSQPSPTTEKV